MAKKEKAAEVPLLAKPYILPDPVPATPDVFRAWKDFEAYLNSADPLLEAADAPSETLKAAGMPVIADVMFFGLTDGKVITDEQAEYRAILDKLFPSPGIMDFQASGVRRFDHGLPKLAIAKGHPLGTPVWFAAMILKKIEEIRKLQPGVRRDRVLILLGQLLERARIQASQPGALEHGIKLTPQRVKFDNSNAIKHAASRREHERWIAAARNIWARNPRLSGTDCATVVIRFLKLDCKPSTVARVIRSIKPK